jgi:hypothetical protein
MNLVTLCTAAKAQFKYTTVEPRESLELTRNSTCFFQYFFQCLI